MEVDSKFVLKELLWKIDDKIVLIISNGLDKIDETALSTELNCKECSMMNPNDIYDVVGTHFRIAND
jgi:prolyl-tRNA editing enzyme YbaK/EbsC (Cys-tRNA(Pro) deacylase)